EDSGNRSGGAENNQPVTDDSTLVLLCRPMPNETKCIKKSSAKDQCDREMGDATVHPRPKERVHNAEILRISRQGLVDHGESVITLDVVYIGDTENGA